MIDHKQASKSSGKQGNVTTVCSAKGGIGQTLLSVNLAIALSKKNLNICLIDGDLQFGDVSLAMDLHPTFTLKDIVDDGDSLDKASLLNYLTDHSSGVQVIAAPERPEYAELITGDLLVKTVSLLKESQDHVVIDAGHGLKSETVELMEVSDEIVVVTSLEMTSLKNTKRMIETLKQLGYENKLRLVVNRYNMESLIKPGDIPGMLEVKRVEYIPNNFKIASQSLNLGIPIVLSRSKSDLSKSIFRIAENVISNRQMELPKKKTSFFGHILSDKN